MSNEGPGNQDKRTPLPPSRAGTSGGEGSLGEVLHVHDAQAVNTVGRKEARAQVALAHGQGDS